MAETEGIGRKMLKYERSPAGWRPRSAMLPFLTILFAASSLPQSKRCRLARPSSIQYVLWPSTFGIESDVVQHQAELTSCLSSFSLSIRTTNNRRDKRKSVATLLLFFSISQHETAPVNNGDWNGVCPVQGLLKRAHLKKKGTASLYRQQ